MNTLAYITIQYSDHSYTATVRSTNVFEDYLSADTRNFKIIRTEIIDPQEAQSIARMLKRISRYGHSLNNTATAN